MDPLSPPWWGAWVFMAAESRLLNRNAPLMLTSSKCLKSTKLASAIGANVPTVIWQGKSQR